MTGVSVTATIIDAKRATMNEMPNGRSIRPSIPLRKKSGMNATMVMIVACTIEVRISVDASYTTFSDGTPFGFREPEILLEPFEDVLHVDDRIIHQRSDGNGHTTETHRVDGKAHQFERENRYEQRERQCYQRDDRRAYVHQEEEQYHHDKKRPFEQGFPDVVDRSFDKAGLTETVGRQVDVRRKLCLDLGDRFVESFGQFQ